MTADPIPEPPDVIRDAISRAIRDGRYWLPADGQQAVADAVLAARDEGVQHLQQRVDLAHQARRETVGYLDEIRVHLIRHGIDPDHLRHDGDIPNRLQELLNELDPPHPA